MSTRQLICVFPTEEGILGALPELRSADFRIAEAYAPYAVHGLDRAAGMRRSRIGFVTVAAAALGSIGFYLFQDWVSAISWPLNIGGKPFSSAPAWIPVVFEAGVLAAGLMTVLALLVRSKLYPGKRPELIDPRITDDRFAVVIEIPDSGFDRDCALEICERYGVEAVEETEAAAEKRRRPRGEAPPLEVWR